MAPSPYEPGLPYPRPALAFLMCLGLAGVASIGLAFLLGTWQTGQLSTILAWCALAIVAESSAVHLVRGNIHVSSTEAIIMATYLSIGLGGAMLAILCATLLYVAKDRDKSRLSLNTHPRLTLFNVCHYALILMILHHLYRSMGGQGAGTEPVLLPAMVTAPLFFLASCLLNALFYRLEEGRPFWAYLKEDLGQHLATAFMISQAAVLVAIAYFRIGNLAIALFALPLMLTRLSILAPPEEWE